MPLQSLTSWQQCYISVAFGVTIDVIDMLLPSVSSVAFYAERSKKIKCLLCLQYK